MVSKLIKVINLQLPLDKQFTLEYWHSTILKILNKYDKIEIIIKDARKTELEKELEHLTK